VPGNTAPLRTRPMRQRGATAQVALAVAPTTLCTPKGAADPEKAASP
jgi:hypothetical protein